MVTTANVTLPSLFEPAHQRAILERLQRLSAQSRPQWGRMDVAQMLAHCQRPLRVATGELQLGRGILGVLFGAWAKRRILSGKPFGEGSPTHPKFVVREPVSFAQEQSALIGLVRRFGEEGPAILTPHPHPFFGPLTADEWGQLQAIHLDHHLRQFGV